MALRSALVDQGRILERPKTQAKVGGEKQHVGPSPGPWFRCRLQLTRSSEGQADGRRRNVTRPTLLMGRNVHLDDGHQVEIKSKQLGRRVYQVDGDPEPLRRRRTVLGYEASLVKVEA